MNKPCLHPIGRRERRAARFFSTILSALSLAGIASAARAQPPAAQPSDIGFCKPYNWLFGGWVAPPRIPCVGDINGDGFADFLYASPKDRAIDVSLNGKGWKPLHGQRLLSNLPQEIRAICLGRFGGDGLDLAILGRQGGLYRSINNGRGSFSAPTLLTSVSLSSGKVWLLEGPGGSHSTDDLIVVQSTGRVAVFGADGRPVHSYNLGGGISDAAAGDIDGSGKASLAARIGGAVRLFRLGSSAVRIASIPAPKGEEALAMGDINADGKADVLVDGRVFLAPHFNLSVPIAGWGRFQKPVIAMMASVVGRNRDDVIVQHEGPDYFGSTEADCDLYITYFKA
ncbi:MAG TPA: hypothetical protein VGS41_16620, partial [Chthonomonadales bacterium]|nr:hypothetical protein [Chthonomonadales bacterium]